MRHSLIATAVATVLIAASAAAHADVLTDTTLSGKTFIDFTNLDQTKNGSDTANAGTGVDIKRFYLTVEHKFDDIWSANLTTDYNVTTRGGKPDFFVKKAWVRAKFSDAFAVSAGADNMPWIPFVEDLYDLRYVEKLLIDRLGYGTSADWGLHAFGSGDNLWNYNVAAVNGAGYRHPRQGDSVDVEGRFGVTPLPGLTFAVGGYSGELGKDTASLPSGSTRTAKRLDFVAAYVNPQLRLGGEYFRQDNWKNVLTTGPKDSADGYAIWGQYKFAPNFSAFARYDHANQSKDINPRLKDAYYNAGLEWIARKGVRVAAVYKHEKLADAVNTTKSNEIGVWAEIAF